MAQPQKRRPRKLDRGSIPPSRPDSTGGGVALPASMIRSFEQDASSPFPGPADPSGPATSSSRRRRPKKLGREPGTETRGETVRASEVRDEIGALKTRVKDIEGQVQEILRRPGVGERKVSRRRLRGAGRKEDDREGEGETRTLELRRLGDSLAATRKKLAQLSVESDGEVEGGLNSLARGKVVEETAVEEPLEESDVEEIERDGSREIPIRPSRPTRAVTLSGSYRIPLPATVSQQDLQAVQRGLSSVGSIARKFAESRSHEDNRGSRDPISTQSGSGWSSWFGGYSMSVARFVNNIEFDSGSDTKAPHLQRPTRSSRSQTEPARRRPPKLRIGNGKDTVPLDRRQAAALLE